jgi:hypothetical protein
MSAMIHDEASFESIFDNLQHFEEEDQAGVAEKQGAGDLLSNAGGSVASEAGAEAAMPIVFGQRKVHSCASVHQSCFAVAKGPSAAQNAIAQAWQQVTQLQPSHNL